MVRADTDSFYEFSVRYVEEIAQFGTDNKNLLLKYDSCRWHILSVFSHFIVTATLSYTLYH